MSSNTTILKNIISVSDNLSEALEGARRFFKTNLTEEQLITIGYLYGQRSQKKESESMVHTFLCLNKRLN